MAYSALTNKKKEELIDLEIDDAKIAKINEKAKKELDVKQERLCLSTLAVPGNMGTRKILRLLLLGKAGAGKSATGNLIVGGESFSENVRSESCTEIIQFEKATVDGIEVQVIDTPSFEVPVQQSSTEIAKIVELYKEGIDGILFVCSLGNSRFNAEEKAAFDKIEQNIRKNCFVIITHGDTMVMTQSLKEYIAEETTTPFGMLLNGMRKKVIAVDNADTTPYGRDLQRKQIVRLILTESSGPCHSTVFQKFSQSQEELVRRAPPSFRHLVKELEHTVVWKLVPFQHNMLRDVSGQIVAGLLEEITRDKTAEKGPEPSLFLQDIVTTVMNRLTGEEFIQPVREFAVYLLMACEGVAIKVPKVGLLKEVKNRFLPKKP